MLSFLIFGKYFSSINPDLYTNVAIWQMCSLPGKINVSTESLKWNTSSFKFFPASDFIATQPTGKENTSTLYSARSHHFLDYLLHYSPVRHSFFQTFSDHIRNNSRVRFW